MRVGWGRGRLISLGRTLSVILTLHGHSFPMENPGKSLVDKDMGVRIASRGKQYVWYKKALDPKI